METNYVLLCGIDRRDHSLPQHFIFKAFLLLSGADVTRR